MDKFCLSLKVASGPGVSNSCVLSHDKKISFGRNRDSDCILSNDPGISRKHFEIHFENGKCWIKDLESRNGTYINGQSIQTSQLNEGDEIRAGKTRLIVKIASDKEAGDKSFPGRHIGPKVNLSVGDETTILIPRDLHGSKIARNKISSETFLKLFHDLPGKAVLIQGTWEADDEFVKDQNTVPINGRCRISFPTDLDTLKRLISRAHANDSIMMLNFSISRSEIIHHIRERADAFSSPQNFVERYDELPMELSNAMLNGMDLMICDNGNQDEVSVVFEKHHSHWLSQLIKEVDGHDQTIVS